MALTPFEALCGFRPISEIKNYLRFVPELRAAIGESKVAHLASNDEVTMQNALKNCFSSLMAQEPEVIEQQLRKLLERFSNLGILIYNFINLFLSTYYFCLNK